MSSKVHFVSLGCPKNRVDTEVMLGDALAGGHEIVGDAEAADVIVVNTCGFIGEAKEESIDTILEMAKLKSEGRAKKLVVTGCLTQRYPKEVAAEIPEIDKIFGSGEVRKVARALHLEHDDERIDVAEEPSYLYDAATARVVSGARYSAYVKIAEGCDRPCAFCIIPKLRGPQRSRTVDDVVREVEELSAAGVREINLVAQDLTKYGDDEGVKDGPTLAQLLRRVARVDGIRWVRLHYAYPTAVTDELIEVIASEPAVVKYLDVPLQHADDKVLKFMRRGHTMKRAIDMVERLRKGVPDIVIRTTFLVGHPGEGDAEFERLCDFVREAKFERVGVFTFSPEDGTAAATLPEQVPAAVAKKRRTALMRLQRTIAKARQKQLVGRELEVLVQGVSSESEYLLEGRWAGQAPEIDGVVYLADGAAQPGDFVRARVTSYADYDLAASIIAVSQPWEHGGPERRPSVVGAGRRLPVVA